MPCQLSPFRSDPCSSLRHHAGLRRINKPKSCNTTVFLSLLDFPGFPINLPSGASSKVIPQSHSANRRVTRPTSSPVIYLAPAPNHPGLRFRFGGPNDLWKTPVCQSRLQPQKHAADPTIRSCASKPTCKKSHGSLRPGNATSSTGVVPFLKYVCQAPPHIHLMVS